MQRTLGLVATLSNVVGSVLVVLALAACVSQAYAQDCVPDYCFGNASCQFTSPFGNFCRLVQCSVAPEECDCTCQDTGLACACQYPD
jgi:hypothetical protein